MVGAAVRHRGQTQVGEVAKPAVAPSWHSGVNANIGAVGCWAGEDAKVKFGPENRRIGDVCKCSAGCEEAGFVVCIANEERYFSEVASERTCRVVAKNGDVVDSRAETA